MLSRAPGVVVAAVACAAVPFACSSGVPHTTGGTDVFSTATAATGSSSSGGGSSSVSSTSGVGTSSGGGATPSSGSTGGNGSSSSSSGPAGFSCVLTLNGDTTAYSCPSQADAQSCGSNVVPCTPTNQLRGTVAPGSTCVGIDVGDDAGTAYELGDDCAPDATWTSASYPKGSACFEYSDATGDTVNFCTHPCKVDSDCSDVTPVLVAGADAGTTSRCSALGECSP